jgi:protein-S-isoprenylcysteine O-methyltransferase Ste14
VLPAVLAICWLTFLAYWIVSARSTKTTVERQRRGRELIMRVPLLAGGYLIWTGGRALGLDRPFVHADAEASQALGCIICALGLAITVWARRTLAGNWSASVTFKEGHELIERGPYAYTRHPIYSGLLLMLLGTSVFLNTGGALAGFVLYFAGLWWKLKLEEALMTKHFPGSYPDYQRRVKALIPRLL